MIPAFILVTDSNCGDASAVASACEPILGFAPDIQRTSIEALAAAIDRHSSGEVFVLPTALDFNLLQREALGQAIGEARRKHPAIVLHHDDADPAHPLVVQALTDQVAGAIGPAGPQRTGLILAAGGHGDAVSRANSYRLMRLMWEQLGLAAGEVGFIRHAQPFLAHTFEKCAGRPLPWIILPQTQWRTEHVEYAEVILQNFQGDHPEAASWRLVEPPGDHPAMIAWLAQRITRLWNEKRSRDAVRIASPKHAVTASPESWSVGSGVIASVPDRAALACLVERILPAAKPDRVLVKVTWHGYATGTYTDPAALDLLLSALPAEAIVLEGHTSSRNVEDAAFNWETEARQNRAWIRQQDAEFLRRTGLAEVLAKHHAEYLNVTEAWWDEDCPPPQTFIPQALLEYRGSPLISFAKFKGPTRLAISNLFGLLPEPLRAPWHGPNLTYLARVCCDLAKLYGAVFPLCGINEALYSAVRWNRQGLYRSRWGNYDLISDAGYLAAARDLATADILASRLQGQDVHRSAFFDVVRAELGWDEAAASDPLPESMLHLFA